jgi:hypothetical protein
MGFRSLTLAGRDMGVIGTVRLWDTTAQCPLGEVTKDGSSPIVSTPPKKATGSDKRYSKGCPRHDVYGGTRKDQGQFGMDY